MIEIILIAISLATDACTVSMCKGMTNNSLKIKKSLLVGLYFGSFQFMMPILGYLLGNNFQKYIISISNVLSFIILVIIGIKMIRESKDNHEYNNHIDFNVNLIPVNEVKESSYKRPTKNDINEFKNILEKNNIAVTIRRELGKDISGSCGQLRASVAN